MSIRRNCRSGTCFPRPARQSSRSPICCRSSISAGRCSSDADHPRTHGTPPGWSGRPPHRRPSIISPSSRSCGAAPTHTRRRRSRRMSEAMEIRAAPQFADLRQQEDVARLGMWVFLATEVLLFGGPIMLYFAYRSAYPAGFGEAGRATKIIIGSANTAILLTSSFAVAWAVAAVKAEAQRFAANLLTAAALLGVVFLVLKGIEYAQEYREGLVPALHFTVQGQWAGAIQLFFIFYFVTTGL